jgi:hypothetical protein
MFRGFVARRFPSFLSNTKCPWLAMGQGHSDLHVLGNVGMPVGKRQLIRGVPRFVGTISDWLYQDTPNRIDPDMPDRLFGELAE